MRVLVTGGAGYIGAHAVRALLARGDDVIIVDDLSTGDPARNPGVPLIELELSAPDAVEPLARARGRRCGAPFRGTEASRRVLRATG